MVGCEAENTCVLIICPVRMVSKAPLKEVAVCNQVPAGVQSECLWAGLGNVEPLPGYVQ